MAPAENFENFNTDITPICFENLEQRLLLTTLNEGDFFIYHNSLGQNIRIDLIGNPNDSVDDSVELVTAWDADGGSNDIFRKDDTYKYNVELMDLPGLKNPDINDVDSWEVINWPEGKVFMPYKLEIEGYGYMEADPNILAFDEDTGEIEKWQPWDMTFTEGNPDADPPVPDKGPFRGAAAEIYTIWINQCSSDTRLVISVLEWDDENFDLENERLFTDIREISEIWTGADFVLAYDEDNEEVTPLDQVGSVIVGARPDPWKDDLDEHGGDLPAYIATSLSIHTAFTGDELPSGIIINDGNDELYKISVSDEDDELFKYDQLYQFDSRPGQSPQDMGRIIVGGIVSGRIRNAGSIDIIEMGFLWGNVEIGHNLGFILMRRGGGGVQVDQDPTDYDPDDIITPDNGSLISVGGSLGMVMVDSVATDPGDLLTWVSDTPFYTAIEVHNEPDVPLPSNDIYERETKAPDYDDEEVVDLLWTQGELVDFNNDVVERAEILTHPTGNFTLHGGGGYDEVEGAEGESQDSADWFALPLMAGQTIVITGGDNDAVLLYGPGDGLDPYAEDPDENFLWYQLPTDPSLHLMATYGYVFEEDWGYSGNEIEHLKPLTFTAPTAGVYYLAISGYNVEGVDYHDWGYNITFQNATYAAFGGLNLVGNYFGSLNSAIGLYEIAVHNGGSIGGVVIHGDAYWLYARTIGGGDIVSFGAETVGQVFEEDYYPCLIQSEGNIGRVESTVDFLAASIEAGAGAYDGSYPRGYYNNDAYVQNIYSASDWGSHIYTGTVLGLAATGSIGVIEITRDINVLGEDIVWHYDFEIRANSDGVGPSATIDLIYVGGTWEGVRLYHGPGGDVGYIYVGGAIRYFGRPAPVHVITDGQPTVFNDDSGGKLTIRPTKQYDSFGDEILDPVDGTPTYYEYAFTQIPVDDYVCGGVGGVMANLRIEGSVNMTATGVVQISTIDITGVDVIEAGGGGGDGDQQPQTGQPEDVIGDTVIKITGPGTVDVYYLDGDNNLTISFEDEAPNLSVDIDSFINETPGRLVSASLGSARLIELGGDLGPVGGHTGAWIFGHDIAPIMNVGQAIEEPHVRFQPQYGWFHGRVHGLNLYRDLDELRVDGFIHDVRIKGTLGIVQANADHLTDPGVWDDWDGISGLIWSQTRIDYVDVGDGLADDGTSVVAEAGIMSTLSIGTVYISGQRYEQSPPTNSGLNESLKPTKVFGEINGSIIGGANDVRQVRRIIVLRDAQGLPIRVLSNTLVPQQLDAVDEVIGEGSTLTAKIFGGDLAFFMGELRRWETLWAGTIGTVAFTGATAEIYGATIQGLNVREVITSINSQGISYTGIVGFQAPADEYSVREVIAGGPGLHDCLISGYGGDIGIGNIKAVGGSAVIEDSYIISSHNLESVSARHLHNNEYHLEGTIGSVTSTNYITSDNYRVGAIQKMTAGGNFNYNQLNVAREISSLDVKGSFNSTIIMQGPSVAYLRSLTVNGNIAGTIESYGYIGTIISRTGLISADITTYSIDWSGDVKLIQTAGGFTGHLDVSGSVERFISYASLGDNPVHGTTQVLDIFGDLGYLNVTGSNSDLFATINVGGDIGNINVDGDLYANITTNSDLDRITVDGKLGGDPGDGIDRGSITVYGSLGKLKFNTSEDLVANITIGSSIDKLSMKGADIVGNIVSLFGSIGRISVNGGSIYGDLTAKSIDRVSVIGGDIEGDILANNANIGKVDIKGGNLEGDLTAEYGYIDSLSIKNGDAADTSTIYGYAGIGKISIVGGDLDADVTSGRGIDSISVKKGSNLRGMVNAETGIGKIDIDGTIFSTVRSGGIIENLFAASLNNAIISSAWDIEKIKIDGNVTDSLILAGYDVGADGALAGGDDNPLNGGQVHSGNIRYIYIGGSLDSSVVAAGVGPGIDNDFLIFPAEDEASGDSNIERMTVRGDFGNNPNASAVLADTYMDSAFYSRAKAAGVVVHSDVIYEIDENDLNDFGPGTNNGKSWTIGGLTLILSSGIANFDYDYGVDTARLVLEDTNAKSSLILKGTYGKTIIIESSDDSGLSNLKIIGNITLGDTSIDGYVKSLQADNVEDGSTWALPGGAKLVRLGQALDNVNITAGQIDRLDVRGSYTSAVLTADAINLLSINGQMSADLNTILGDASKIYIKGGNLSGDLSIRGNTRLLYASGALSGNVSLTNGDLSIVKAGSLSGIIDVDRGETRSVIVNNNNFSGSYRALEVNSFIVRRAGFTGLLSVKGDLRGLSVRGTMSGKVWAGGNIRTVYSANLNGALVAASGDLMKVIIKGNMTNSYIFAGFNPGDAGYDEVTGEQGNVAIDAFDPPLSSEQIDQGFAGNIKMVNINGYMQNSTIAAGINPGDDGYVGTDDDTIAGSGYISKVIVRGNIGAIDQSYGIYAANNMPTVTSHGQPFLQSGNAYVRDLSSWAGSLAVTDFKVKFNAIEVTFNHPLDFSTIDESTFELIVSTDGSFDPSTDHVISFGSPGDDANATYEVKGDENDQSTDFITYVVTLTLNGETWNSLGYGSFYQLTVDADLASDIRGNTLEQPYVTTGIFVD